MVPFGVPALLDLPLTQTLFSGAAKEEQNTPQTQTFIPHGLKLVERQQTQLTEQLDRPGHGFLGMTDPLGRVSSNSHFHPTTRPGTLPAPNTFDLQKKRTTGWTLPFRQDMQVTKAARQLHNSRTTLNFALLISKNPNEHRGEEWAHEHISSHEYLHLPPRAFGREFSWKPSENEGENDDAPMQNLVKFSPSSLLHHTPNG